MQRHLQAHLDAKSVPDSSPVNPVPCLDKKELMFNKMVNLAMSSHEKSKMAGAGNAKNEEDDSVPKFVPEHQRCVRSSIFLFSNHDLHAIPVLFLALPRKSIIYLLQNALPFFIFYISLFFIKSSHYLFRSSNLKIKWYIMIFLGRKWEICTTILTQSKKCRYVCSVAECNYLSVEEAMLRHHLKALHSDEIYFRCPHCPPPQDPSQNIAIDKMAVHLKMHDSRLYKCSHCIYYHFHRFVYLTTRHLSFILYSFIKKKYFFHCSINNYFKEILWW